MNARTLPPESYKNLWCNKEKIFDRKLELRIDRLQKGRLKIEKNGAENECANRLCLMFSVNEITHYSLTATATELDLQQGCRRMTAALEKFAKDNKISKQDLTNDQKKNRNFFQLLLKAGPGSLLEIERIAVLE